MFTDVPVNHLGGTAEVAIELGCPKQQVHALRRKSSFPQPVWRLAATPVWDLREVRVWGGTWKRRKFKLTPTT